MAGSVLQGRRKRVAKPSRQILRAKKGTKTNREPHKSSHQSYLVSLCLDSLGLLLLLNLEEKRAVDVWKDTAKSDGGTDQGIQFFVATDGELEMTRRDTLDLEVLRSVLW